MEEETIRLLTGAGIAFAGVMTGVVITLIGVWLGNRRMK